MKLGIAVKINSLNMASGSALNVQPGGILEVLSGLANDGQVTFADSTSRLRLTQDNVSLLGTGVISLGGGAVLEVPAGVHASNGALHTLSGDGASQSINGTLQLDGTLTNNGTLILGPASTVSIGISGTGTHVWRARE